MNSYYLKHLKYSAYRILTLYRRFGRKKYNNLLNKKFRFIKEDNFDLLTGYYDINLFSSDDKKLLYHKVKQKSSENFEVELFILDLENNKKIFIDKTKLFCMQFGSRLSWFENNIVSANTIKNEIFSTSLWEVKNNIPILYNQFSKTIYSWSNNLQFGAIINMKRLSALRPGYGYKSKNYILKTKIPEDDGLEIINYNSKTISHFFSFKDICCDEYADKKYKDYYHYISHLVWNSDSSIIMFDYVITNFKQRFSKLCFINLENSDIWYWDLANTLDVSHFTWLSSNQFLVSSNKTLGGFNFFIGHYKKNDFENLNLNKRDGHPFKYKNSDKILLDTYPDRYSEQSLYILSLKDYKTQNIGTFYSPLKFKGINKCDLHPKISSSDKLIGIDCCINGKREILVIENS